MQNSNSNSNSKSKPILIKNLGFAGGGFYGIAQVAALKELENYKEYFDIKRIRGVSVGSMVAALYAIGYTPDELTKILFDMDFDKLIKDTYFAYYKLYERFGMYEAQKLEEEMERLIRIKTNIKLCTFCQIDKDLTIISTNLNYQCPRFFNKENTPDMPISKAIRMSIGYPLIMTPILFEGDLYGDGGEFMNYPITTFDNMEETLGITFAAHNENINGTLKHRIPINDVYDYIKSIGTTMSRATYVSQITSEYLKRSIVIHITENISSMQFNLTNEQKNTIYNCGIKAVKDQIVQILDISQ
jgi:NTE family protein